MDTYGGPTSSILTSLGDSAPVLDGKTLAHFYIGVREIDAIADGQIVVLGSSSTPYQMDLLQYQNGSTDWMTETSVPAQTYSQLRYVIDVPSTQAVFTDGTSMPVKFSGGNSSSSVGMGASTSTTADPTYSNSVDAIVNTPFDVQTNGASVMADFNLMESLNEDDGTVIVRPAAAIADSPGQISGSVAGSGGAAVQNAVVVAIGSNGSVANTAATDANGAFNLHALPADTYRLVVYNAYTNAAGYLVSASGQSSGSQTILGPSVSVTAGSTVSAGTIGD